MSVKKIKKTLLKNNPHNPKHKFSKKEVEFLQHSIDKNEFIGYPIVIKDYEEPDKFIVIDGNSRISLIKSEEIECYVIDKVLTGDKQLKELTLDYTAVSKKLNRKKMVEMYDELGIADAVYDDMFNEINVNFLDTIDSIEHAKEEFVKVKMFKFLTEDSWETFQALYKKLKNKMFDNNKVREAIESMIADLPDDELEGYFFDILMSHVSKGV